MSTQRITSYYVSQSVTDGGSPVPIWCVYSEKFTAHARFPYGDPIDGSQRHVSCHESEAEASAEAERLFKRGERERATHPPEVERWLSALHQHGYTDLDVMHTPHGPVRPGTRVRIASGDGTVLHLTENKNSAWAKSWGSRDIEIILRMDTGRPAQVAQYHLHRVYES